MDDNRVNWTDPVKKIGQIELEIASYEKDVAQLEQLDPQSKREHWYRTNGDILQWTKEQIQELHKLRQLIKDHHLNGDVVAEVTIRHWDELNETLKEMEKNKQLFILEVSE